jgi:anti-anti-sigma regulatory factor
MPTKPPRRRRLGAHDCAVAIDMIEVPHIDLTFLHELEALRSRLTHRVTVVGVNRHARHVLQIVNLDHLFQIVEA